MKCPKCQYISFGSDSRCRNCGYEFSLTEEAPPIDLPIGSENQPLGPLTDLPLVADSFRAQGTELPLFAGQGARDDAPLVSAPAVPRAPLAVRRGAAVLPKPRARQGDAREPVLDLEEPAPVPQPPGRSSVAEAPSVPGPSAEFSQTAPVFRRLGAALIDLSIAGAIDAAVVYLTLRLTNLQVAEIGNLPALPLAAFLLLLNGGYFVLFTAAGGQTIGKMATAIRVVPHTADGGSGRLAFSTAVLRTTAYIASLLPAGLGFVPILFSQDGRTLHDRLADTRVVKA